MSHKSIQTKEGRSVKNILTKRATYVKSIHFKRSQSVKNIQTLKAKLYQSYTNIYRSFSEEHITKRMSVCKKTYQQSKFVYKIYTKLPRLKEYTNKCKAL